MAFRDRNYGNNITCTDRVIVGHLDTTLTSDINIVGSNNRQIKINGIIPSGGSGSVPDPLTINTIIVDDSFVCDGICNINKEVQANDGIDVTAGNITMTGTSQSISTGATGTVTTNGISVDGPATMKTINLENGVEADRIIYCPRYSTRYTAGGFMFQQPPASNANQDTLFMEMPASGAKYDILKSGGTQGVLADTCLRIENDNGIIRTGGKIFTKGQINMRQDGLGGWEINQPASGEANDTGLSIESPSATSTFAIIDETGSPIITQTKLLRTLNTPLTLNTLNFGSYSFSPEQWTRTLTNFTVVTTAIPAGAITQVPLFVTGNNTTGVISTNDWENVNTGDTAQFVTDPGFYKVTLLQTGGSGGSATNFLNDLRVIFDFAFSTPNDDSPRISPPLTYSFLHVEPDPTSVPIVTLVPALSCWSVYINFPTYPTGLVLDNLIIKVTKMPY